MSFSQLVTFGCSLTFGMNLADNYPNNEVPSKFSWPANLAKLLDAPIENKALLGASNKEILYTLLNYNFKNDDIVFVLWSHHDRHCIITEDNVEPISISHKKTKRYSCFFKQLWNLYDRKIENYFYYNFAHLYLQEKNIKHVFLAHERPYIDLTLEWNSVNFLNVFLTDIRNRYPFAKDNSHPGIEAHKLFAEVIYHKYNTNDFYIGDKK